LQAWDGFVALAVFDWKTAVQWSDWCRSMSKGAHNSIRTHSLEAS